MKILLIGPVNSNKHAAEIGIKNAAESLGWEVEVWDPRQQKARANHAWQGFSFSSDLDFALVCGCVPHMDKLSRFEKNCPLINWNAEEIRLEEYKVRVARSASSFDFIFHFDESALSLYPDQDKVAWLPLGFDEYRHRYIPSDKIKRKVLFIGSMGGKHIARRGLHDFLRRNGVPCDFITSFDPEENSRLYSKYALSINLGLTPPEFAPIQFRSYGYQQRLFEAMGSNSYVLTNTPEKWPQYNFMFSLVPDFNVGFWTKDTLLDQIYSLLDNHKVLAEKRGWVAESKFQHTYKWRLQCMQNILEQKGIL